jgi:TRAP-type C4-dicarboxylate transport system permease large subunit
MKGRPLGRDRWKTRAFRAARPLHYGIVLIVAMGIGLFAPPLGLGLYTSCAVGGVPNEQTARPIAKYLALMLACLLILALVQEMTLAVPRALGFIR